MNVDSFSTAAYKKIEGGMPIAMVVRHLKIYLIREACKLSTTNSEAARRLGISKGTLFHFGNYFGIRTELQDILDFNDCKRRMK